MKGKLLFWAGIVFSFFFLWVFIFGLDFSIAGKKLQYSGIDFHAVGSALGKANYYYIFPYLLLYAMVYGIRALRWKYFMYPIKNISFKSLFSATMIGFMSTAVLPARAGEVVKPVVIGIKEGVSKSSAFATVVVERVFDMVTLLLFSGIMLMSFKFPEGEYAGIEKNLRYGGILIAVVTVALIGFLVLLKIRSDIVMTILKKIFFFLPQHIMETIMGLVDSFVIGLGVLHNVKHLIYTSLLSMALWIVMAASFYPMLPAFGLSLPFSAPILIMILIALGVALPSSPGFIGIYQVACEVALKLMDVEPATAKSYAIAMWALNMIPTIIIGLIFLSMEKLSFKQIRSA